MPEPKGRGLVDALAEPEVWMTRARTRAQASLPPKAVDVESTDQPTVGPTRVDGSTDHSPETDEPRRRKSSAPLTVVPEDPCAFYHSLFENHQACICAPAATPGAGTPDDTYVVERLLDHGPDDDGRFAFLVKWYGYPRSEATWEFPWSIDYNKVARYCRRKRIDVPDAQLWQHPDAIGLGN